ncbi:MAG: hypothetical protein ACK56F_02745, partial [bacterium]
SSAASDVYKRQDLHLHCRRQRQMCIRDSKRVVVIGSGATAMTIVPAMAKDVAKITMLQRSPTFVISRPSVDPFAKRMRRLYPKRIAYALTRIENTTRQQELY